MKLNDSFWRWFGNSAVVDKTNSPLVVYHGSDKEFTRFKAPSHFAEAAWYAEFFTLGRGGIIPAYLSIQKPLDLISFGLRRTPIEEFLAFFEKRDIDLGAVGAAFRKYRVGYSEPVWGFVRDITADQNLSKAFVKAMLDAGFDGLVQGEDYQGNEAVVWVPMKAAQIKSAIGNDGDWSAERDDIRQNPPRCL